MGGNVKDDVGRWRWESHGDGSILENWINSKDDRTYHYVRKFARLSDALTSNRGGICKKFEASLLDYTEGNLARNTLSRTSNLWP